MQCPICDSDSIDNLNKCSLCGYEIPSENHIKQPSQISPALNVTTFWSKTKIVIFLFSVLVVGGLLVTFTDNFILPEEIAKSQHAFSLVKAKYEADKGVWQERKNQLLRMMKYYGVESDVTSQNVIFGSIPLEIFLAYFDDELDFLYRDFFVYPTVIDQNKSKIFIGKLDEMWGFLPVVYSVELMLYSKDDEIHVAFGELRRGKQVLKREKVFDIFPNELIRLEFLSEFSKNISNLTWIKETLPSSFNGKEPEIALSWKYKEISFY